MDLKKGWNFFFVGYGVFQALWDFYMSVPDSANLTFNPSKEMDSDVFFMTSGPFNGDMYELSGRSEIRFQSHKDLPREMGWEPQLKSKRANNPAWDIAWQKLDQSLDISAHKVSDFKISSGEETALFFDMGGKKLGRIFIEYDAPKGTTVDIAFSEDLKDGRPSVLKRPGIYTATRHIAAEGENYFETFKPYGLRYLHVNITGNKGDVKLKRIGVKSQIYPFERVGSFECSDPLFNGLWELGWRTLEVCSEDTYTDTPFRERGLYAGDALPEYAITLATSGDSRLMKRSLEVLQHMYADLFFPDTEKPDDTPGTIFDFPFISLEYFRWSVEYTEDMEFAKKLYPRYKYLVESALKLRDDRGLLDHPRVFIEWTQIDKNAQLTAMQGIFARSLKNMSVLADMLDKPKEAERYKQLEDEMVMAINKYCYDDETGAYRDGFKDGKAIDNYYPISSAWMSLNNYSPEEREKQLADFYAAELEDIGDVSRQRKTTPYGGFYVMGALFNQGYVDVAEEFIRKYYGPFVLKHDDTAWENFDDGSQGQGQGTLSHAWSGGPTYYFTTEILGVKLGFPYYYNPGKVEISPQSKSVNWAKGTVPHPEGVISVSWKIKGDNLFLDYSGPSGIDYTVRPKGRLAKYNLIVNGRKMH
jgi:hypothetical protein